MARIEKEMAFSLDCELIWGMRKGVPKIYIENNVYNAVKSLNKIISRWDESTNVTLYLAFVAKTIPSIDISNQDMNLLHDRGYGDYANSRYMKFNDSIYTDKLNVKFGLHSIKHELYNEMSDDELESEIKGITDIVDADKRYSGLFVYPKNIAVAKSIDSYRHNFDYIRVNSKSWLYKSTEKKVGIVKRILRYCDSFIPIFELFCNKEAEHNFNNAVVGTHFFRANLSSCLLYIHYFRLRVGIYVMKRFGLNVHIWSHPHNFNAQNKSVEMFCDLAERCG